MIHRDGRLATAHFCDCASPSADDDAELRRDIRGLYQTLQEVSHEGAESGGTVNDEFNALDRSTRGTVFNRRPTS